jgi:hypothetical protein
MDKMKLYAVISPLCMLFSQGIMPLRLNSWQGATSIRLPFLRAKTLST